MEVCGKGETEGQMPGEESKMLLYEGLQPGTTGTSRLMTHIFPPFLL